MAQLKSIHIGFIALIDAAPLIVAREMGFASEEGLSIHLHREVSWANIRDKLNAGMIDCAHMLAPMPLAATLGIGHLKTDLIAPMTLSLNGSAITVSRALDASMREHDPDNAIKGGRASAHALAKAVAERNRGEEPLTFGTVYPFSCHTYELRDWLAAAGLVPDKDVRLVVLPPSLMTASLEADQIQGFCAGEPWNSVAVERGAGVIIATKRELWGLAPDKVLGTRLGWAHEHGEELAALIRALTQAAAWLEHPANRLQAVDRLAEPAFLDVPATIATRALTGALVRTPGDPAGRDDGFVRFSDDGASHPSVPHAMWLLAQMARWGEIQADIDVADTARSVFRTDLFAAATNDARPAATKVDDAVRLAAGFDDRDVARFLHSIEICADRKRLLAIAAAQA